MTWIDISTEEFSNDALFPRRHIEIGEKELETPAKAIPARHLRDKAGETFAPDTRGVYELHKTIDVESLTKARRGNIRVITKRLETDYNKTTEDSIVFTFFTWDEGQTFVEKEAQILVDVLKNYSDVLTIPLMPKLFGAVEEGLSDAAYQSYKRNVKLFLEAARTAFPETPIMGVIPPLGWEFTDNLMKLYEKYDVRAFCMNLNRTRITAGTKIEMVRPMMRHIARRDIADNVLFYGINLHPGQNDESLGLQPAANMAALGMGFDIVGENHVGMSGTAELFEKLEEQAPDEVRFSFFDKEEFAYKDVLLAELPLHFPEETGFDPDQVVRQAADSENHHLPRLEKLLSAEQMALAARELQREIPSGTAFEHITSKPGVPQGTAAALQSVREGFDTGQSQSSLGDF